MGGGWSLKKKKSDSAIRGVFLCLRGVGVCVEEDERICGVFSLSFLLFLVVFLL